MSIIDKLAAFPYIMRGYSLSSLIIYEQFRDEVKNFKFNIASQNNMSYNSYIKIHHLEPQTTQSLNSLYGQTFKQRKKSMQKETKLTLIHNNHEMYDLIIHDFIYKSIQYFQKFTENSHKSYSIRGIML